MKKELVSIVVLSYKNLQYIKQTINSILSQDYENIELIIGDDSTDGFNDKLYEDYINKNNLGNITNLIIYKNSMNLGIVKNLNKAISLSKGKYIKAIAADDTFDTNNVISRVVEYMENSDNMILATNILWCDHNMKELKMAKKQIGWYRRKLKMLTDSSEAFKELCRHCFIPAPGIFFKKAFFEKYGMFNEEYILMDDWPKWLEVLRKGAKFDYLDIISVKYRVGVGVSTSKEPNPIFIEDNIRCIKNEILPYKKQLSYWTNKNVKYSLIRQHEFKQYYILKKILFLLNNIDVILVDQVNKLKYRI